MLSAGVGGPIPSDDVPATSAGGPAPGNPSLSDPSGGGPIPSDGTVLTPFLYLSSVTGLSATSPGYPLAPGTDLTALAASITDAMRQGTPCTVAFGGAGKSGVLVLNGAALPFAVLGQVVART
ncbi:MAG: hypothetical protein ACLPN6_25150 [Streptosporangiaceae bacterium]